MTDEQYDDVTPESLMDRVKGPNLVKLVVLTVVVHVVVIVGSSVPALIKSFKKVDTSKMKREARVDVAFKEATAALREIAKQHKINPQDISEQFGSGGSRTRKQTESEDEASKKAAQDEGDKPAEPEKKSAIEEKIETKAEGPKLPTFDDKKDDIF